MKPDFSNRLAAQLRDNPSLLEEIDDILLGELVGHYYEGELDVEDAAEVASMLQTNPKAKAIYQRIEAADRFATSPAGKTWLGNLRNRVLPSLTESPQAAPTPASFIHYLETLADAITKLFTFRATLATASGNEGMERILDDGKTRVFLKLDSAGRLWLQVTSTADKYAGKTVQVGVQPTPALLSFSEVSPGVHDACMCVSAELAAALSSGAELKLTPFPQS